MGLKDDIKKGLKDFRSLCIDHKVKYLYAFGSAISDKFDHTNSDIDFLVEIDDADPIGRGEKLIDLWDKY